jgi:PKD repeat protein
MNCSASVTAGTNVVYSWDFGDDGTALGQTVQHKYKQSGPFTVTVTATNDTSSTSATTDVTVGDPALSVADVGAAEGTSPPDPKLTTATVTVSLSAPTTHDVTFTLATADATAHAPGDYRAVNALVTIPAGRKQVHVKLKIGADATVESDETFTVSLSSPSGASIKDGVATVTILDDD